MAETYATARPGRLTALASRLSARARRRRHRTFLAVLCPGPGARIVDVGCGALGLRAVDREHEIVGVDAIDQPAYPGPFVRASAAALPFPSGEFDIAYSNSLIEHVPPEERPAVAAEIRRVADRYFVQTPNRWFPVEPHVLLPLFQFLPERARRRLWRFGVAGGAYERIDLLDRRELERLFPDAVVLRERVGPLTKSLLAVGPRSRVSAGARGRRRPWRAARGRVR